MYAEEDTYVGNGRKVVVTVRLDTVESVGRPEDGTESGFKKELSELGVKPEEEELDDVEVDKIDVEVLTRDIDVFPTDWVFAGGCGGSSL